jgi:hypothetical protein
MQIFLERIEYTREREKKTKGRLDYSDEFRSLLTDYSQSEW